MEEKLLIKVDYGITDGQLIHNCNVLCKGEKISAIGGASAFSSVPHNWSLNLPECYVMPGLIDTHLYGANGFSTLDDDTELSLKEISVHLGKHGVTTFVPSMQTPSRKKELELLEHFFQSEETFTDCAEPFGIHAVGPFISPDKKGSHPREGIRLVDLGELDEMISVAKGNLKIMTFAPELENSIQLVEKLLENDIIPSMGHSKAAATDVFKAIDAGAKRCTHLFNAMPALHQREQGLSSIALVDDRVTVELIADGYHIHPHMIKLACHAKGKKKIIAVSTSSQWAGKPDGEYSKNNKKVLIENQHCHLEDGTIAGSMATLDKCWKNFLKFSGMANSDAVSCFTANPAENLGFTDRGFLNPGLRADLVIMNKKHEVEATISRGKIVYLKHKDALVKNE